MTVAPFVDFLAAYTRKQIPLRSDAAVESVLGQLEDSTRRLAGELPLVFCGGESGWSGFGVAGTLPADQTTMVATVRDGLVTAGGVGWTGHPACGPWPRGDRLVLAYAGDGRSAALISRAEGPADGGRQPRSYAFWSYDTTIARLASIWVGVYLAQHATDAAVRWNAGINAMGERGDGAIQRLLRQRRLERAMRRSADDASSAEGAAARPRLGEDIRQRGVVRGQPPWGW